MTDLNIVSGQDMRDMALSSKITKIVTFTKDTNCSQIAGKYDMQKEEELRFWIEEVTAMAIGENFQKGLKDGVILGE